MAESTWRPLSVCETDQEALSALITIHAPNAKRVLDCTFSKGTMWRGLNPTTFDVIRSDLSPQTLLDVQADYTKLPFLINTFDCIIYDPPHIADGGKNGLMHKRYGSNIGNGLEDMMYDFLAEASWVLKPKGVILAKIANGVHGQKFINWSNKFLYIADDLGFDQVDEMIRARKNIVIDPKWKNVYHVKRSHIYWLAVQKP